MGDVLKFPQPDPEEEPYERFQTPAWKAFEKRLPPEKVTTMKELMNACLDQEEESPES